MKRFRLCRKDMSHLRELEGLRGNPVAQLRLVPLRVLLSVILFHLGLLALASAQENQPASDAVAPSIGLEIGQRAPAFVLTDQFGHEQSNETLKGSKGTVLLFFRSADW